MSIFLYIFLNQCRLFYVLLWLNKCLGLIEGFRAMFYSQRLQYFLEHWTLDDDEVETGLLQSSGCLVKADLTRRH